jgi:nucleoid DNA-binding protein
LVSLNDNEISMNIRDLVQDLASRTDLAPAEAADHLDRIVSGILRRLKSGSSVKVPGLGVLEPNKETGISLKQNPVNRERRTPNHALPNHRKMDKNK